MTSGNEEKLGEFEAGKRAEEDAPPFDVRVLWASTRSRIPAILASGLVCGLLAFVATLFISPVYKAEVRLIKHTKNNNLDPDMFLEPKMSTILETVRLRSNLERARNDLRLEESAGDLHGAIGVERNERSEVITITSTWSNPDTAAAIANRIAEIFIVSSGRLQSGVATGTYEFYKAQREQAAAELARAHDELEAFENRHNVRFFEQSSGMVFEKLKTLELDHARLMLEIQENQTRYVEINRALAATPREVPLTQTVEFRTRARYEEMQGELQGLLERYTPENPKVIALQREMDALSAKLQAEGTSPEAPASPGSDRQAAVPSGRASPAAVTYGINPIFESLEVERSGIEVGIDALRKRQSSLQSLIGSYQGQLGNFSDAEKTYMAMRQSIALGEAKLMAIEDKLNEAELTMRSNISGFQIVERAARPAAHEPTFRKPLIAGGVLVGLLGALVLVNALELVDLRVKSRFDLERVLGVEALGTLPARRGSTPAFARDLLVVLGNLVDRIGIGGPRTLVVCSQNADEGKSFVARELAGLLARQDRRVLIVDAVSAEDADEVPGASALNDFLLRGSGALPQPASGVGGTSELHLLRTPDLAQTPLLPDRIAAFQRAYADRYDLIVWITPEMAETPHVSQAVAKAADAVLVVAGFRAASRGRLQESLDLLRRSGVRRLLGILNRVPEAYQNV